MVQRTCSIEGCETSHYAKGWCRTHYQRWWRGGDPLGLGGAHSSPDESFLARTVRDEVSGCLVWTGAKFASGYGNIKVEGRNVYAHRYAWERANGPAPTGTVIDHICHRRECVEPAHLRPATLAQNAWHREKAVSGNRTGVLNVKKSHGKYQVAMTRNGVLHHGGTFETLDEAAQVARRMRAELSGAFAGDMRNPITARAARRDEENR